MLDRLNHAMSACGPLADFAPPPLDVRLREKAERRSPPSVGVFAGQVRSVISLTFLFARWDAILLRFPAPIQLARDPGTKALTLQASYSILMARGWLRLPGADPSFRPTLSAVEVTYRSR
jgi:hypothetical protein